MFSSETRNKINIKWASCHKIEMKAKNDWSRALFSPCPQAQESDLWTTFGGTWPFRCCLTRNKVCISIVQQHSCILAVHYSNINLILIQRGNSRTSAQAQPRLKARALAHALIYLQSNRLHDTHIPDTRALFSNNRQ